MKILTVCGQDSSGKSTFLALGAAMLLKKELTRTQKPRVLLVCKTTHQLKHMLRLYSEATESLGLVGDSGDHGCYVLHTMSLCTPTRLLQESYDYVVADTPGAWPNMYAWATRNIKNIRFLVASQDANQREQHYSPEEELEDVAA